MVTIREYYKEQKEKDPNIESCPGDYGLDCPIEYWTEVCPDKPNTCWNHAITKENKSIIKSPDIELLFNAR